MGFRETINERPKTVAGVVAAVLVVFISLSIWLSSGGGAPGGRGGVDKAFFSSDDGANFFVDDAKNLPPYTKDGKEAVRAYVYKCADGKPFVAYLQRYTAKGKQAVQAAEAAAASGKPADMIPVDGLSFAEVKLPGKANKWVNQALDVAANITATPKCRDGSSPVVVVPE